MALSQRQTSTTFFPGKQNHFLSESCTSLPSHFCSNKYPEALWKSLLSALLCYGSITFAAAAAHPHFFFPLYLGFSLTAKVTATHLVLPWVLQSQHQCIQYRHWEQPKVNEPAGVDGMPWRDDDRNVWTTFRCFRWSVLMILNKWHVWTDGKCAWNAQWAHVAFDSLSLSADKADFFTFGTI